MTDDKRASVWNRVANVDFGAVGTPEELEALRLANPKDIPRKLILETVRVL
jgi:hypothetical protein